MTDDGDVREDLSLPDGDIGNEIKAKFEKDESLLVSTSSSQGLSKVIIELTNTLK
ncbi:hypothetical protein DPMN_101015 [Dreissena polymorpha]|uniref:Translation initiation factor 5A C-terminal domain-containing protein n=1 Tax=Dreissena polymorpha TaxID=45954 RepID=A0A9D4R7Y3_DREPO|nr:hypothetical protein DPMN_101015 [Dreissena polymorpha]